MADMIADALATLTETIVEFGSRLVVYTREGVDIPNVPAMIGSKLLRVDDGMGGLRFEYTDMDFLIASRFLILPSTTQPFAPARGDLIRVAMPFETQTFEVFPFGSDPPWRWADPNQTMCRIHTKLIGPIVP
jgi:hypothetical protein